MYTDSYLGLFHDKMKCSTNQERMHGGRVEKTVGGKNYSTYIRYQIQYIDAASSTRIRCSVYEKDLAEDTQVVIVRNVQSETSFKSHYWNDHDKDDDDRSSHLFQITGSVGSSMSSLQCGDDHGCCKASLSGSFLWKDGFGPIDIVVIQYKRRGGGNNERAPPTGNGTLYKMPREKCIGALLSYRPYFDRSRLFA